MRPRKRAPARKPRAADLGVAVPSVRGDAEAPAPAEDVVGRVPHASPTCRGDRAVRPAERPTPPVDACQLDELLDGLFAWPVSTQDMHDAAAAVREMWPGCQTEALHYHGCEVHVTVVWGDWAHGPRVQRVVRQPGVVTPRPTVMPR